MAKNKENAADMLGISSDQTPPTEAVQDQLLQTETPTSIEVNNPDASDEARQAIAEDARRRQAENKPARPKRKFLVGQEKTPVMADNELEARAIYNDAQGKWPSPKLVPVVPAE